MFNLFKRHNKNYNPIITTTPPADLQNVKGVNTLVIAKGCNNDACVEPSKRLIGFGTRYVTADMAKRGISRHINTYACDKFDECRGECGICNP